MSHDLVPGGLRQLSGSQLQHRLLADLDGLLREIEDGTVKENTFEGCIAPGKSTLLRRAQRWILFFWIDSAG